MSNTGTTTDRRTDAPPGGREGADVGREGPDGDGADAGTAGSRFGALADRLPLRATLFPAVVLGWLLLELLARVGFALGGVAALEPILGTEPAAFSGSALALAVGFPVAAVLLSRYARWVGQSPAAWEYDWSRRSVAVGVAAGLASLGVAAGAARLDAALFGGTGEAAGALLGAIRAAPWIAAVFLVGNGVLVPVAEERVWRGIAQTDLVERLPVPGTAGVAVAVAVTAVLFSLKHAVVDASLGRLFTITALGLVWGAVRHRWGTGASTVAHAVTNVVATTQLIVAALA